MVDELWSHCNVLRDDGVGAIEHSEQLTKLPFLKMAHERLESERFHASGLDELVARDEANFDITWLRDESLIEVAVSWGCAPRHRVRWGSAGVAGRPLPTGFVQPGQSVLVSPP